MSKGAHLTALEVRSLVYLLLDGIAVIDGEPDAMPSDDWIGMAYDQALDLLDRLYGEEGD